MCSVTLQDLEPGNTAIIQSLKLFGGKRRRVLDLGFQPDTEVACVFRAPAGSPSAFLVKNALICLRAVDCKNILVCKHE